MKKFILTTITILISHSVLANDYCGSLIDTWPNGGNPISVPSVWEKEDMSAEMVFNYDSKTKSVTGYYEGYDINDVSKVDHRGIQGSCVDNQLHVSGNGIEFTAMMLKPNIVRGIPAMNISNWTKDSSILLKNKSITGAYQ